MLVITVIATGLGLVAAVSALVLSIKNRKGV
jgi:hypothetical protein